MEANTQKTTSLFRSAVNWISSEPKEAKTQRGVMTVAQYKDSLKTKKEKSKKESNPYGNVIKETVIVGGKTFNSRSRWEANYARVLEFQKKKGIISDWSYEPTIFKFTAITCGVTSYLPDFFVTYPDGNQEYHEVKGRMDAKSKTKLNRMAKYYPSVKMVLIDSKRYAEIKKAYESLIIDWQ